MTTPRVIRLSPSGPPILFSSAFVSAQVVGTAADEGLRALEGADGVVAVADGYHTPGDRGGGVFVWESTPSPNDDGLFIATGVPYGSDAAAPGWRRLTDGGALDVAWFGGLGDYDPTSGTGGTYDTPAIQRALELLSTDPGRWSLEIPDGIWKITQTIQPHDGQRITGRNNPILWGVGVDAVITLGFRTPAPLIVNSVSLSDLTVLCSSAAAGAAGIDVYAAQDCCSERVYIGGPWTYAVKSIIGGDGGVAYNCRFEFLRFSWIAGRYPFAAPPVPTNGIWVEGAWTATQVRCDWFAIPGYSIKMKQVDPAGILSPSIQGMIQGAGFGGGAGVAVELEGAVRARIRDLYGENNATADISLISCFGVTVDASEMSVKERNCKGTRVVSALYLDSNNGNQGTHVEGGLSTGAAPSSTIRTDQLAVTGPNAAAEVARVGLADAVVVDAEPANLVINGDFRRWFSGSAPWGFIAAATSATFERCGVGQTDTTQTNGSPLCAKISGSATTAAIKLFGALSSAYLNTTITVSIKSKVATAGPGVLMQVGELGGPGWDVTRPAIALAAGPIVVENGFSVYQYTFTLDGDLGQGAQLNFQVLGATAVYLSELQVVLGTGAPLHYQGRARTIDGTLESAANGGVVTYSSGAAPGGTDPFYGLAWLVGDRSLNTASSFPEAWVVSSVGPVVWRPESVQSYFGAGTLDPAALPTLGSYRLVNLGTIYGRGNGGLNARILAQGAGDEWFVFDGTQSNTFFFFSSAWNWIVQYSGVTRWVVTDRNMQLDQALELLPVPLPANPTGNRKKIFVGDGTGGTVAGTLYQLNSAGVFTPL